MPKLCQRYVLIAEILQCLPLIHIHGQISKSNGDKRIRSDFSLNVEYRLLEEIVLLKGMDSPEMAAWHTASGYDEEICVLFLYLLVCRLDGSFCKPYSAWAIHSIVAHVMLGEKKL